MIAKIISCSTPSWWYKDLVGREVKVSYCKDDESLYELADFSLIDPADVEIGDVLYYLHKVDAVILPRGKSITISEMHLEVLTVFMLREFSDSVKKIIEVYSQDDTVFVEFDKFYGKVTIISDNGAIDEIINILKEYEVNYTENETIVSKDYP